MTDFPESYRDLFDSYAGILCTIGSSGIPQSSAVWFVYDDGELHSWLSDARQKVKNLLDRPEFSLLILDTANPDRYLALRGRAELVPDNDLRLVGDKLAAKYGRELRSFRREGETRYAVTFHATSVFARDAGG